MTEIIDLGEREQVQLTGEIARRPQALKAVTECDKLNVAALGNVVAQLHVHVIGAGIPTDGLAEAGLGRRAADQAIRACGARRALMRRAACKGARWE